MRMNKKEIVKRLEELEDATLKVQKIIIIRESLKIDYFTNEKLRDEFLNAKILVFEYYWKEYTIKEILNCLSEFNIDTLERVISYYRHILDKQIILNQYFKGETQSKRKVGRPRKEK